MAQLWFCAVCLGVGDKRVATTLWQGTSLCEPHLQQVFEIEEQPPRPAPET